MKIYQPILSLLLTFIFLACNSKQDNLAEKSKAEILQAEKDFQEEVRQHGMTAGFTKYAAPDAVMNFSDSLVKGRDGIENYYKSRKIDSNKLEWTATFVDAAKSGEMGYTYGDYTYIVKDSTGKTDTLKGVFHSVWKKQPDGSWKFVWD